MRKRTGTATVLTVEAGGQRGCDVALVDQLRAVGMCPRDCATLQIIQHLSVPCAVLVGDKIRRGYGGNGFFYAIAVAIVNNLHAAALHQPVLKVIHIGHA